MATEIIASFKKPESQDVTINAGWLIGLQCYYRGLKNIKGSDKSETSLISLICAGEHSYCLLIISSRLIIVPTQRFQKPMCIFISPRVY